MRIGVVVDATCDLPQEFLREHNISILPVSIRLGEETVLDERDPEVTRKFYSEQLDAKGINAETIPFTADQIRQKFLDRIVIDYDYVFCITITSNRSPIFENATRASFAILNDYKNIRAQAGVTGPFALRVVDSMSMFCGTGLLAAEAAKLCQAGKTPNDIRRRLDDLRENICGYMVPSDLYYIRARGKKKGENSVGLLTWAIGSALDIKPVIQCYRAETEPVAKVLGYDRAVEKMFSHVAHQIEKGISTGHICISYGGELEHIPKLLGYDMLAAVAREYKIEILNSVMSATAALNAGGGCVAIAYGGELRDFGS
ncbi:MAG: DegV family protein [Stenotrophobium sp.]